MMEKSVGGDGSGVDKITENPFHEIIQFAR